MKTKLETNNRLFNCLTALRKGYEKGDFIGFLTCLAQDCIFESQWVMTPNVGYDAVASYLTGKGETLKRTGNFPDCSIVELVGSLNPIEEASIHMGDEMSIGSIGLLYTPGKLCMLMEQTIDDKTNGVIADLRLNDDGMVDRVDLCMPELFNYRHFYTHCTFFPAVDASTETEIGDGMIHVSESYFDELHLFLGSEGIKFDAYSELHIPMEQWTTAIEKWSQFACAPSFDEAYESICGIDYETMTVKNEDALRRMSRAGARMWNERKINEPMLNGLVEWTAKYKDSCKYVNSYGF